MNKTTNFVEKMSNLKKKHPLGENRTIKIKKFLTEKKSEKKFRGKIGPT